MIWDAEIPLKFTIFMLKLSNDFWLLIVLDRAWVSILHLAIVVMLGLTPLTIFSYIALLLRPSSGKLLCTLVLVPFPGILFARSGSVFLSSGFFGITNTCP